MPPSTSPVSLCFYLLALASVVSGFVGPPGPSVRPSTSPRGHLLPMARGRPAGPFHGFSRRFGIPGKKTTARSKWRPFSKGTDSVARSYYRGGGGMPPMGGGPGGRGPQFDTGLLVPVVFTLLVLFAPGVIFGAFNVLFLTVALLPVILTVGVNIYTSFTTIKGPCPVCGAELQGSKEGQSLCLNCGAVLEASGDKFEVASSGYVRDETGRREEFQPGPPPPSSSGPRSWGGRGGGDVASKDGVIDVDAVEVDD